MWKNEKDHFNELRSERHSKLQSCFLVLSAKNTCLQSTRVTPALEMFYQIDTVNFLGLMRAAYRMHIVSS